MILFFILCSGSFLSPSTVFASLHITLPSSPLGTLTAVGHVKTCNVFLRLGKSAHSWCLIFLLFLIFLIYLLFALAFLGFPGGISHCNFKGEDRLVDIWYLSKAFVSIHHLGFGNILKDADVLVLVKAARGSKLRLRPERHQRKRDCGPKDFSLHSAN